MPRVRNILCFGNSLTAGYGLSSSQAWPALIQQRINALHMPYQVINGGRNGDTSGGGVMRIAQYLHDPVDVFILELGINDLPRGILPTQTAANLQKIIDHVKETHPKSRMVLAGMEVPSLAIPREISMFLNDPVVAAFRNIFGEVARHNNMAYIPFLLKGVAGIANLNLMDRIHPNAQGHQIIAENVWEVLSAILD
jgi:acyl-CoA thioesterase-1